MTNSERDAKQAQGRQLYIKGMSHQTISDILGVSYKTILAWSKEGKWEDAKRLANISPSEIKNMILDYIGALKEKRKPEYSADVISKIVKAYETVSDKKRQIAYNIDSFEELCHFLFKKAVGARSEKQKKALVDFVKTMRQYMDEYIDELIHEQD